jgi:hypothetical protein
MCFLAVLVALCVMVLASCAPPLMSAQRHCHSIMLWCRSLVHRFRQRVVRARRRSDRMHLALFFARQASKCALIFAYALGVTEASVAGVIMDCLQHFFNLNLLLFLDLHWSDVFHPRLSKKARRNWRTFIVLNVLFNAFYVLGSCPRHVDCRLRVGCLCCVCV